MSGLGLVWDIARNAMAAQRYGMDVTSHNIANVNTAGYSRQNPVFEAKRAETYGGLLFGRGVDTSEVRRISDRFIESRLMEQKSGLSYSQEMENYMKVLEGIFSEDPETGVSAMLAGFWNKWQDISNNPAGTSERTALYEYSMQLTEQIHSIDEGMRQLATDLTNAVNSGIGDINRISEEIAQINNQIVGMEAGGVANDLRDKRNDLISELSGYIDVKSFEQDNATVTVITARGCVLVGGNESYNLTSDGAGGEGIVWQGSGGAVTDITGQITKGKLGGWLDMRDKILAGYELNLDAMVREFAWSVNRQHSQGAGLEAFETTTGSYQSILPGSAAGSAASGLVFHDRIQDGSFNIWLYDENGDVAGGGATAIVIDADVTPLYDADPLTDDIVSQINAINPNISAELTGGKLKISASGGYTFAFSDDTSNSLAAFGINTFFSGESAGNIEARADIGAGTGFIAAALIADDGSFSTGDNRNAIAVSDLQNAPVSFSRWICDRVNPDTESSVTTTFEDYYHALAGSVGIVSAGISGEKSFNEMMAGKLAEIRDGISAVSLDEEMTNLIKYQHAYTAATKLISAADEMLKTLLEVK